MLTPCQSAQLYIARFGSTEGRTSRSEFWWICAFVKIVTYLLLTVITFFLNHVLGPEVYHQHTWMLYVPNIIVFCLNLLLLNLSIRRMHDLGLSGWFAILLFLPLLTILFMLICVLPSQHKSNKYGPDPTSDPEQHFRYYRFGLKA